MIYLIATALLTWILLGHIALLPLWLLVGVLLTVVLFAINPRLHYPWWSGFFLGPLMLVEIARLLLEKPIGKTYQGKAIRKLEW